MKSIDKVKSILKSSCCYLLTILQTYEPEMLHKISVRQKQLNYGTKNECCVEMKIMKPLIWIVLKNLMTVATSTILKI